MDLTDCILIVCVQMAYIVYNNAKYVQYVSSDDVTKINIVLDVLF